MAEAIDLRGAVVVRPDGQPRVAKAAAMLVDEVASRTRIRWRIAAEWPDEGVPVVAVGHSGLGESWAGPASGAVPAEGGRAEGYRIAAVEARRGPSLVVAGHDERGCLFGAGRLLRAMRMGRDRVEAARDLRIDSAPVVALRGHQLGYRPKTNSYDAWTLEIWEQYLRDLAVFGTNAVELIPPRSDDDADSPHFPLPALEMMTGMSRLLDEYGLDVWIWYPAMDASYDDPATVDAALAEWDAVFRELPRIDAVFVPGGDPGHTAPEPLMALLERQSEQLRRRHPRAGIWVSPQGFDAEWMERFLAILRDRSPAWLAGVVYGPQVRMTLPDLRLRVPPQYPIRRYPDITHTRQCQYPVPNWDLAYALTEARESINPRPVGYARIFELYREHAIGFITYSEGCNDDLNKIVWSALGWDPDADIAGIVREYSRYFLGEPAADGFAHGLMALERNWDGPLLTNGGVTTTLRQFQAMEDAASPRMKLSWRFQQALYRAHYDAYVRSRLIAETDLEERAMEALRSAPEVGALAAVGLAEEILARAWTDRAAADLRARVFELAEALYQSIRMQLSVRRYAAIDVGRGANLDTIDAPLNNAPWLRAQFASIRRIEDEGERQRAVAAVVDWTNPGPGGRYDDLGAPGGSGCIDAGSGWSDDPAFYATPMIGYAGRDEARVSWCRFAQSLWDAPLRLRYEGLDPEAAYRVRVVYAGDSPRHPVRLSANGVEVHPLQGKPSPVRPLEFDLPPAGPGGALLLEWNGAPGRGGNGRGCQVAEVWLIRRPARDDR